MPYFAPSFAAASCNATASVQKLDPSRAPNDFGAEYGSAIVPRFVEDGAEQATFYWVVSTWHPYRVVLMKTTIAKPEISD